MNLASFFKSTRNNGLSSSGHLKQEGSLRNTGNDVNVTHGKTFAWN